MKKTSIKVIIIAIIFFAFLFLTKSDSLAKSYTSISDLKKASSYTTSDVYYGNSMASVFGNDDVFCIQAGQDYVPSYKYKFKKKIRINSSNNSVYQPLIYMAQNFKKTDYKFRNSNEMTYFNNSCQIAFWAYIWKYEDDMDPAFSIANYSYLKSGTMNLKNAWGGIDGSITGPAAIIKGTALQFRYYGCFSKELLPGLNENIDSNWRKPANNACDVYKEALNNSGNLTADMYIFTSEDSQNFVFFKNIGIDDKPITINFKKTDVENNALEGASIKINSDSNCSFAEKTLKSDEDGFFGKLLIEPSISGLPIKVKVKEFRSPAGYLLYNKEITLTIKYNSRTGAITSIKKDGDDENLLTIKGTTATITLKNKTDTGGVAVKVYKRDQDDNQLKGAKFKITYSQQQSGETIVQRETLSLTDVSKGIAPTFKTNGSTEDITVTVNETDKPTGCTGNLAKVEFTLQWDGTKWQPNRYTVTDTYNSLIPFDGTLGTCTYYCQNKIRTSNNKTFSIKIKNEKPKKPDPIYLTVKKVDDNSNALTGANFDVTFQQGRNSTIKKITLDSGKTYETVGYRPFNTTQPIDVTISESKVPDGYLGAEDVKIRFEYNEGKGWKPTITQGYDQIDPFIGEWIDTAKNHYYPCYCGTKPGGRFCSGNCDGDQWVAPDGKTYNGRLIRTDYVEGVRDFNQSFGLKIKNSNVIKDVSLYKKDKSGNAVQGAEFNVLLENVDYIKIKGIKTTANSNKQITITRTSNSNFEGLIEKIDEIKGTKGIEEPVYMTITEKEAPSGFGKLPTEAKLEFTYNTSTKKWELKERNNNELSNEFYQIDNANDRFTLTLKDDCKLDKLTILKTDSLDGNKVQGAKFNVTLGNVKSVKGYSINSSGTTTLTGVTTNANGNIELEDVVIKDINEPITITMEETDVPEGYKQIEGKVTVKLKRDGNAYKITEQSKESTVLDSEFKVGNAKVEGNTVSIGINDIPALQKLNLFKLDSQNNSDLTGAEFKVNFSNVESYYVNGDEKTDTSTTVTVKAGKPLIEKILLENINEPATITLEETNAPIGYKKLVGKIYLTVKYTDAGYTIVEATKDETISNKEFNTADVGITNKKNANVTIKDIPVMNIGGIVWEDKQYGEKLADVDERYKGIPEDINDILLSGVEVYLTDGEPQFDDGRVKNAIAETKTANGGEKVTYVGHMGEVKTTLQKGEYLFAGIEKKDNYYVVFKYDGINYITVEKGTENNASKVEEKGRAEFNKKFQTIESGKAIAEDGSSIDLYYNSANGKSKLITKDNEGNIKPEFVMYAQSDKVNSSDWQNTWTEDGVVNKADSRLNINCGIKDRFFDLAIGMDVESAKLTINGKETKYNYNQILNGDLEDIDFDKISKDVKDENGNDIEYNLYLYYSDYNYRISDYITDGIDNNISTPGEGEEKDSKVLDDKVVNVNEELRAFVTYKVIIKNQSTVEVAKVNKLAYYYDKNYELISIGSTIDATTGLAKNESSIKRTEEGEKLGKNKVIVEDFAQYLNSSNNYRQELYFTFEVKKSEDGTRSLPKDVECANIVEILSYSTIDGLIDHDSAPGNFEPGRYEDDTDEAQGINIKIKSEERKITGTVFDDTYKQNPDGSYNIYDKDGVLNNNNKAVNDVIVQLIEVKPIENESGITKYYEYIWQETRSGSNTVKTTAKNGSTTESYTNGVVENSGIYEFTNFIPGNYIIRFIYGDGSTYDLTDNVKKYNGQDYQSTKDTKYKSSWYNTAEYEEGQSVARDNEARRLDVMAYSTMIDKDKGTELELTSTDESIIKVTLNNTWMAAETSRINVPVDADDKKTDSPKRTVSFENINNIVLFDNMNFGLAKRPETKLKLEKHITSLKIVPNGVGVKPIIEAKAKKIEDIVNCTNANGETVELQGVTTGLTAISSTRDNRNFWKVETDIEELAQGATLEVEYTYVIKNDSDEDYLGSELVNQYKTNLDGYSDYLKDLKESVKAIMRTGQYAYSDINAIGGYLGEFYYTGNKGTSDSPVLSRAETLKESLNEQFGKQSTVGDYFNVRDFDSSKDINTYKDTDGNDVSSGKNISTVIESNSTSEFLKRKAGSNYTDEDADWSKTAKVTTVLSVSSNGTIGGNYPSYIAEITKYSNAAGRRNMEATPGNLSYVHSEATDITMNSVYNEDDEFWGESIIISKPTGEDKLSGVQIAVISTISVAILGAGIILIKKFVLKK